MRRMIAPLALLAATTLFAAAPVAMAGDRDGDEDGIARVRLRLRLRACR